MDFIRETRKTKKISDSIVLKIMQYLDKYSFVRVEYGIRMHMSMPEKSSAQEEYTFGIVRKSTDGEALRKLSFLRSKNAGDPASAYSKGRLTLEQLEALEKGEILL
ncbi:hypothetical protein D3C87_1531370 [compost metagenome]